MKAIATEPIVQEEITAEIFKIIRANDHTNAKYLYEIIKDCLPEISNKELSEALLYLYKKSE